MSITRQEFLKLQNGSDIRGVACVGVEGENVNITNEAAYLIGQAFAQWIAGKTGTKPEECKVGIGMDSRITGKTLKQMMTAGMLSKGVNVCDCKMASTPAMFMSIVYPETKFTASCMITASHLPFNRNGFKFFNEDGGLEKADITEILNIAADLAPECADEKISEVENILKNAADCGRLETYDLITLYAQRLQEKIKADIKDNSDKPLEGLKIVVDAGNGAGGFFAEKVLRPLGADTEGSSYLEPDGMFPNHIPNPEDKTAMEAICSSTVNSQADLGLIFDTDVDRMSAVLADGTPVNRDSIIAMMSAILAPDYPGSTIITDSVTSDRLTDFLEKELGLKHLCYKRGYKNVINKCKELNASGIVSPLAMETSGHGCMKENYYLDDGAYLAVKITAAAAKAKKQGKTINELIEKLSTEYAAREVRFKINTDDFKEYGNLVLEGFKADAGSRGLKMPVTYEGVRVGFEGDCSGWVLLRASLHDPVMVLNMEGRTAEDLSKITVKISEMMRGFEKIDISPLNCEI